MWKVSLLLGTVFAAVKPVREAHLKLRKSQKSLQKAVQQLETLASGSTNELLRAQLNVLDHLLKGADYDLMAVDPIREEEMAVDDGELEAMLEEHVTSQDPGLVRFDEETVPRHVPLPLQNQLQAFEGLHRLTLVDKLHECTEAGFPEATWQTRGPHLQNAPFAAIGYLGSGAQGVICGMQDRTGRRVAIKSTLLTTMHRLRKFKEEVHTGMTVHHRNVMKIYDAYAPTFAGRNQHGLIVMEYVDGNSLSGIIKRRRNGSYGRHQPYSVRESAYLL
ncbi:MAG: hypothetical protein MHM6MM_002287 [Cercozoa sp. M6MM]